MQAIFTTSTLAVGSHSITAVYSGDSGYTSSTSATLNEAVQLFSTSASLSASDDSITAGKSVTFTATVTGVGAGVALPTGTVTFKDGTTVLGTATLSGTNSGMQAVFTTSALASGTHSITAVYGGDSTFAGSTSPVLVETVAVDSTNTTLSSSALAALPGQSVTFTATVTGADDGTPTGTVTFEDGSTVLGTATLSAATSGAQATFTTSTLASGLHSISAVYSGDSTYTGSSSAALGELVEQVGSFAELSSSANPVTAGQAVTFTATISGTAGQAPTGTVTFKDGSTVLGTATLSAITADTADLWSAQATFTTSTLATGMHTIQAIYSGDSGYLGSSASLSQNVSSSTATASTTTLSSSATAALPGQAVTFTTTITGSGGGTPTGTVTFHDGGTVLGTATLSAISSGAQATFTISTLTNGTHIITAVYSGDSTYAGSTSSALLESIQPASSSTTTLSSSTTSSAPGQAVTLTATVRTSGGAAPTGTVTFQDGCTVLGTVTLSPGLNDMPGSSTAQAAFTTSGLTLGAHSITAVYNGANVFTASSSTALSLTVQQASAATSLSSSADSTQFGQSVVLTATVTSSGGATPTGTVTFQDGTTVLGVAVLSATASGAQASFSTSALAIGSHSLTAVYNGDNSFTASESANLTQTVSQDSTTTTLSSSAPSVTSGQSLVLTATVTGSNGGTATGTITFMDGTTVLGTATLSATSSGVQATFTTSTLAAGAHTITAVYSGDSTFAGSTSDILNQIVTDGTTLSSATILSSSTYQAAPGQVMTFTATVTGVDGGAPTGTVTFEDGSTVLGSAALSAGSSGAQAVFNTSALAAGSHSITAVYNGDSNYAASTAPALSVTIQAGASSSTGSNVPSTDTGSDTGTSSDSSLLDSSSADGMGVADLFDGELYSKSGISTPLSPNTATSSSASTTASNSPISSGNTAATPPQGPLDSSSSNLSTSGTFQRHYTEWGNNASASFYLDVTCNITITPSTQSGTITYTAYLEDDGDFLVDDQNVVVPVSNPTLITDGSPLGNLPATGEIVGYTTDDFGFDDFNWDQTHERGNSSFNGTGTYTAANGVSYSLNQNSSKTSSWDSVRAYTDDGSGSNSGTVVNTNQYGDSWKYDLTASDVAANFSTDTQYDANGYPTDLFAAPAGGTTYLARAFNGGSDWGFAINTNSVVDGANAGQASSLQFNSYGGVTGSRYYYNNTATVNGSSSGNSDTVAWNVSQQSTSSYGGSQFSDLSYNGGLQSGTVTTKANTSGQSSSSSSMTDTYQRNSGGVQANGTFQMSSSTPTPQSYNSQATENQTYSSGALTSDTLTYNNGSGGSSSMTVSNSDSYTATTPKGTTKGSDFSISSGGGQSQSNASGSLNLLTNTSSVISISSSSSSGWSLSSSGANYNASDGSASSERSSLLFTMGGAFAFSVIAGGFNASGTQTSGTSYNFSIDGGGVIGSTSSQSWTTGNPTFTYEQEVNGNYNDDATTDLSANSDGTANGSIEAHSNSSTTTDTTTRILGTQKLTDGTAFYNNKNHSNDVYTTAFRVDVSLSSGLANGEVVQGAHDNMTWDYKVNVTADTNTAYNTVHAKLSGSGNGSTGIDDTVWAFYDNGTPEVAQTFVFTQKGTKTGSVTANGTIKDGNGHTGTWTLTPNADAQGSNAKASTTSSVNDRLTIRMTLGNSGWNETYRRFSINDSSASGDKYHEEDNGLGRPATPPGFTESYSNKEDITTASSSTTIEKGTPTNYSFTINESRSQHTTQSSNGSWSNAALGEGGKSNSSSDSRQKDVLNRTGTEVNGLRALSNLQYSKDSINHSESHGTIWSPSSVNTYNSTTDVIFHEWRQGSTGPGGSGNGSRSIYIKMASWGTSLNKSDPNAKTVPWGTQNPPAYNPPNVDLSWGPNARPASSVEDQLSADFWRDPGVQLVNSGLQWLGARLGGILQIVGGSIAFVGGFGIAFPGGVVSGGTSVIPGVALMGVGVDEILTGVYNVSNPGVQQMSVLGYGFYSGAQGLGASDGTAQMMSILGPMAVTLGLGAWGGMASGAAGATRRFFWDPRDFRVISREYWAINGPANGRSLHHWLFPQRARWIPLGLRNAGFNLLEMPAWPTIRGFNLNTWMGFAPRWGWGPMLGANSLEWSIRLAIPGSILGGGYLGYLLGQWLGN